MILSNSFPLVARIVFCSESRGVRCSIKASSADEFGLLAILTSIATLMAQESNL